MGKKRAAAKVCETCGRQRRTAREIVDTCNELARKKYQAQGYEVRKGFRFDLAVHPAETSLWNAAVEAFELIDGGSVEGALAELGEL